MKILFGGTFDPVHVGHINLALYINKLANHKISFLPLSGVPNYKSEPLANLNQRLDMLNIIVSKYPNEIDIDYNEASITQYSPTVQTLRRLRKIYGDEEPIYFIIGGDSLISLDKWDEWQNLFALTNFIVAMREDYQLDKMSKQLSKIVNPIMTSQFKIQAYGSVIITNFTPINVSSTEIRKAVHSDMNIDNLIDNDVYQYIVNENLYT